MPRLSLPLIVLAALLPALVSATYFTSPQQSTVWDTAAGQTITWKYQAGGASRGDILLASAAANPKAALTTAVASNVDLTTESLTFPSGVALRSRDQQFYLQIVNSASPTEVYTQVGPFTITSFSGSATPSSAPSTPPSNDGGAVGNGSGGDSSDAGTNPPVSTTSTSRRSRSTVLSTVTLPIGGASSSSSTTTSALSSPSSSRSPNSSSTTTTADLVTSTILSTASGVIVTASSSSAAENVTSIVTVTSTSSPAAAQTASLIPSAENSQGGGNGAGQVKTGAASVLVAALTMVVSLAVVA
ncbi:hypothetical protein JCM11251_004324 [Rhodosporidiobolus azoricus]